MRNLLIGNGVIIQYGGAAYLNSSIVNRALENIRNERFPAHLYPKECADFVVVLQKEHARALRGEYDKYVFTSYDRSSLKDFKRRYSTARSYSVDEIGFEDYFLLFELVHSKQSVGNPDRFNNRGVLKRMFLDAVYNGGEIENVHRNFPPRFVAWLKEHDQLFTTNYDSNLDTAYGKDVFHLHGSFCTLSETYDPNSFRNQLNDDLLDGEQVDPNYLYLYSNCLVSYFGDLKISSMTQSSLANRGMEKFAAAYERDPSIRKQIDEWDDNNELVNRLKEAIKLKVKQPELKHSEQYPHNMLKQITDSLEIVGLSPNNDGHLFAQILANDQISEIRFYYFGEQEAADAERLFQSKSLKTKYVRELWAEMQAS
jgi:hypothetical protein